MCQDFTEMDNWKFLLGAVMITISTIGVCGQFEWRCSERNASHSVLPELGFRDSANVESLEDSNQVIVFSPGSDVDVFYTVPSILSCSGTVTAVEYCYVTRDLGVSDVYTLLILEEDGLTYTITKALNISSRATEEKCTADFSVWFCCDTTLLNEVDYFTLPAQSFAFGFVPPPSSNLSQNAFQISYLSPQEVKYNFDASFLGTQPTVGNTFSVDMANINVNLGVRAFQFVIDTQEVPTVQKSTAVAESSAATKEDGLETMSTMPSTEINGLPIGAIIGIPATALLLILVVVLTAIVICTALACKHKKLVTAASVAYGAHSRHPPPSAQLVHSQHQWRSSLQTDAEDSGYYCYINDYSSISPMTESLRAKRSVDISMTHNPDFGVYEKETGGRQSSSSTRLTDEITASINEAYGAPINSQFDESLRPMFPGKVSELVEDENTKAKEKLQISLSFNQAYGITEESV